MYKDINNGMREFLNKLIKLSEENPEKAQKEAEKALYKTGVTYKDGTLKEQIVTESYLSLKRK